MNHEALLVGTLAVLLGLAGLMAAIVNRDHWYCLDKIRWLEAVAGRRTARVLYGVLGLLLIALGVAIALGLRPPAASSEPRAEEASAASA